MCPERIPLPPQLNISSLPHLCCIRPWPAFNKNCPFKSVSQELRHAWHPLVILLYPWIPPAYSLVLSPPPTRSFSSSNTTIIGHRCQLSWVKPSYCFNKRHISCFLGGSVVCGPSLWVSDKDLGRWEAYRVTGMGEAVTWTSGGQDATWARHQVPWITWAHKPEVGSRQRAHEKRFLKVRWTGVLWPHPGPVFWAQSGSGWRSGQCLGSWGAGIRAAVLAPKTWNLRRKQHQGECTLMMSLENEYITREGKSLLMLPAQVLHSHGEWDRGWAWLGMTLLSCHCECETCDKMSAYNLKTSKKYEAVKKRQTI